MEENVAVDTDVKQVDGQVEEAQSNARDEKIVIDTRVKQDDGQVKCPQCGASEIEQDIRTGKLRCTYCACEFGNESSNKIKDLKSLKGTVVGAGTADLVEEDNNVVTLKCGGCGAEIVVDTSNALNARCHWCRSILSIDNKLQNGLKPDVILPFAKRKEEAQKAISQFVGKRQFFANPVFKKEFTTNNIMGVYFPYMLVDANCHAVYEGVGEHLVKTYTRGSGDDKRTYYDADAYSVRREFDVTIEDLSIESNSTRLDNSSETQTNNIINSIMPFDTENCVKYQPNFLVGYTSERRDTNIAVLDDKVKRQFRDVSKFSLNKKLGFYDRGIKWTNQDVNIIGTQWMAAYLPVWLYSYQEVTGNKKILHYVAVNARTGETMGSVPINMPLLLGVSAIVEVIGSVIGLVLFFMVNSGSDDSDGAYFLVLLLSGFVYYFIMYSKYRNKEARHSYEAETKCDISNLECSDKLIEKRTGLSNSHIDGKNNETLEGDSPLKINSKENDKK